MNTTRTRRLTKPPRLNPGDTVGIIAPASPPFDPGAVDRVVTQVERLGFSPKLGGHVRSRHGYLAGSDRDRAADLMRMFSDSRVNGIICLRGGYGTARLLDRLDFGVIRRNPKVFAGYSDLTTLHCAFQTQARLVTFHSPMLNEGLGAKTFPDFSNRSFLRAVSEAKPFGSIGVGYRRRTTHTIRRGTATGRLTGGNLALLVTTLGTPIQPDFRNRILFLEDIDERPYRIDRMLTHLLNAGVLRQVAGIAIGVNVDCEEKGKAREYRQSVADVLEERLKPLGVPVATGLPFGHQPLNATLPVGVRAQLDATRGDLVILEAAVK